MVGQPYGRWTVLSYSHTKGPHKYYNCRCECGKERPVQGWSLVYGKTLSCGCLRKEVNSELHATHRSCSHPAYKTWTGMKKRCQNEDAQNYKYYGGRGIRVCEQWATFEGFWADMGSTWEPGLTIERNDNDGGYTPDNCRWATMLEQAQNKRTSRIIDTPWGPIIQAEAARRAGISVQTLSSRMRAGWPKELWLCPSLRKRTIGEGAS